MTNLDHPMNGPCEVVVKSDHPMNSPCEVVVDYSIYLHAEQVHTISSELALSQNHFTAASNEEGSHEDEQLFSTFMAQC